MKKFSADDVRAAYFAREVTERARSEGESVDSYIRSVLPVSYTADGDIDRAATEAAQRGEWKRLRHGQAILNQARVVMSGRTTAISADDMIASTAAPVVRVRAGHIAASEAYRDVTLVLR